MDDRITCQSLLKVALLTPHSKYMIAPASIKLSVKPLSSVLCSPLNQYGVCRLSFRNLSVKNVVAVLQVIKGWDEGVAQMSKGIFTPPPRGSIQWHTS